jgi:hypothetical protein
MSYSVEKLPNEPVVLSVLYADHNVAIEGEQSLMDTLKVLDAQRNPVYLVLDILEMNFRLDDAIQAVSMATQQNQVFKHPRIIETVAVTNSRLMQLVAKGMKSATFGNLNIRVFDSRSAALAYARTQAAALTR